MGNGDFVFMAGLTEIKTSKTYCILRTGDSDTVSVNYEGLDARG